MNKAARIAIGLLFLASLGLSGCGVKGPLERPEGSPKQTVGGPDGKKPHKGFVLDRLL